jgi:hypothetical protein
MILKNEFSMIRLSFGENWELGLKTNLRIEPWKDVRLMQSLYTDLR